MALREQCKSCGEKTIPRRILGFYIGSPDRVKIWECRECFALWSENIYHQRKTERVTASTKAH